MSRNPIHVSGSTQRMTAENVVVFRRAGRSCRHCIVGTVLCLCELSDEWGERGGDGAPHLFGIPAGPLRKRKDVHK